MTHPRRTREFLLLCCYCDGDNPGCTDARPCADCLEMCNIFVVPKISTDRDLVYRRQLGKFTLPSELMTFGQFLKLKFDQFMGRL